MVDGLRTASDWTEALRRSLGERWRLDDENGRPLVQPHHLEGGSALQPGRGASLGRCFAPRRGAERLAGTRRRRRPANRAEARRRSVAPSRAGTRQANSMRLSGETDLASCAWCRRIVPLRSPTSSAEHARCAPSPPAAAVSVRIRSSSTLAGSSLGSWSASLPSKAHLRMDWRRRAQRRWISVTECSACDDATAKSLDFGDDPRLLGRGRQAERRAARALVTDVEHVACCLAASSIRTTPARRSSSSTSSANQRGRTLAAGRRGSGGLEDRQPAMPSGTWRVSQLARALGTFERACRPARARRSS